MTHTVFECVDLAAQLISNMWLTVASSSILPEVTEVAWHSYMVRCTFVHVPLLCDLYVECYTLRSTENHRIAHVANDIWYHYTAVNITKRQKLGVMHLLTDSSVGIPFLTETFFTLYIKLTSCHGTGPATQYFSFRLWNYIL